MNDNTMFERFSSLHTQSDIGMYYCGKRINTPNHEYGPQIRNHYLFVLCNKGNAVMLPDKKIRFGEHDLLIMQPGEKIHYKAFGDWSIIWLGLYGESVLDYLNLLEITPTNPVLHISLYNELKAIMDKIYDIANDTSIQANLSVTGLIYEFFSVLIKCRDLNYKTDIINASLKIIDYNFLSDISVKKISEYLSVDHSYFSRKFTEKMHISPKQYIINKRIDYAKELLTNTNANICEVSNSVGYEDQFYFYKIFKKYTKLSPSEYRKKNSQPFVTKPQQR